jgi:hypothetical protein
MGLAGHGSNHGLAQRTAAVAARAGSLEPDRQLDTQVRSRLRRRWGEVRRAIETVLASAGELRARDIHAAVEELLGEEVSPSSVKNCLATYSGGREPSFVRVGRGRYRLV